MSKLLVICGPTATGKTSLGIKLAKKFNGEVISADSRQAYRGMDIGTGKEIGNVKFQISNVKFQISNVKLQIGYYKIDGITAWLYDVVEPDYRFSVADYVECANLVLKDIIRRKKLPILVGGTGFYIKSLLDGVETVGIPPDWEFREKLSNYQIIKLSNLLKSLDPAKWEKMNPSDRKNPRRLIRAFEIAQYKHTSEVEGTPPKAREDTSEVKAIDVLMVGLTAPNKVLYQRIDKRVEERVKQGVVEEIKSLLERGYSFKNSVLGETIGYKEFEPYLEGEIGLFEAIQKWKYDEHAYARKQMTWFKKALRQARGVWFDLTKRGFEKKIEEEVKNWFCKNPK
jgi:tRNA dimethylallyltransferase